jgi:phosphomannomutase
MITKKENLAMEARYGEWFSAFIENSNENERQGAIMELLLKRLKERVPGALVLESTKPPVFVDLMCGPGGMILPRFGGQSHYAAIAAVCDLNSNSIGLT